MAVYKSSHKGSQIDEAVTIAVGNKNKGNTNLPIYYDANGVAQPISVDNAATANSNKLLTGGGMYNGLTPKLSNNEIQTTVNTSGLPPSQGAAKKYTDTQVGALQDPLISSDTINVGSDGKISVTDEVLRRGTSKLDKKVDHFAEYGIGNDSTVLSEMDEAAHSTFCGVNGSGESDTKKFTKVGSPIVTSDGIAEGFSGHNYLTIPTFKANNTYKISFVMNTKDYKSGNRWQSPYSEGRISYISNGIYTELETQGSSFSFRVGNGSQQQSIPVTGIQEYTTYKVDFEFDGTSYKLYLDGVLKNSATAIVLRGNTTSTITMIGGSYEGSSTTNSYPFKGSIDLKSIYIIADGVPVFSGNKTGIDTIKPDDYTVVGTPTISADGIASGFSSSNYLRISNSILVDNNVFTSKNYKIKLGIVRTVSSGSLIFTTGNYGLTVFASNYNRITVNLSSNGTSWDIGDSVASNPNVFVDNKPYIYTFERDASHYYVKQLNVETGIETTIITIDSTADLYVASGGNSGIGYHSWYGALNGSIDLNAFKIYVDGDLVYQPCLKIPYTLSKDGNKIVDNIYRSRVEDEYSQAGYTPYYTLQRELGDNYTVVGSPTISADGIASGFSSSNYLICNKDFDLTSVDNWELNVRFKQTTSSSDGYIVGYYASGSNRYKNIQIQVMNSVVNLSISNNGSSWLFAQPTSLTLTNNVTYDIKVKFTGTQYLLDAKVVDSDTYTNYFTYDSTSKTYGLYRTSLGCGGGTSSLEAVLGSIDLNAFKIYVDNKLVYTAARNYTLPTVEEEDIISSAEDGVIMYTQRANLALEQTGSCTANTAYTFPKPFMNADYALSIPYTSGTKTATGFTPAESGEYIAEGLGKLY